MLAHTLQHNLKLIMKIFERIVASLILGYLMISVPGAARVLEKVLTWIHGYINCF